MAGDQLECKQPLVTAEGLFFCMDENKNDANGNGTGSANDAIKQMLDPFKNAASWVEKNLPHVSVEPQEQMKQTSTPAAETHEHQPVNVGTVPGQETSSPPAPIAEVPKTEGPAASERVHKPAVPAGVTESHGADTPSPSQVQTNHSVR